MGLSFEDFLNKNIFEPLQLNNSRVINLLSKTDNFENKTKWFFLNKDLSTSRFDGVSGDGSVFVSISDYYIWFKALINYTLVSKNTWKEAISPAILNDGSESLYGFGWQQDTEENLIYHSGAWLGARTLVYINLKTKSVIAIFDSSSNDHYPNRILAHAKELNL